MKQCPKCFEEAPDESKFCPNCGGSLDDVEGDDQDEFVGKTIVDKFKIIRQLGVGAMGSVYEAEQLSLNKRVAIKVLHKHLLGDQSLSKRFHREARAASMINHPNCIQIIDFGQTDNGVLFIAMEYIKGRDLADILYDEYPLADERIIHIMGQTASALDEAHAQNVIHRDLKPENIMVMERRQDPDFVKVLDFGIAKIQDSGGDARHTFQTMAGIVCGTPEYMSPEQAKGEKLDPRSDLYSFGVILFQLYTGQIPFNASTPIAVVTKHITEAPPRPSDFFPDIPPRMEELILRLLAKKRERRPATALEVQQELEEISKYLILKKAGHYDRVDADKTMIETRSPLLDLEIAKMDLGMSDKIKVPVDPQDEKTVMANAAMTDLNATGPLTGPPPSGSGDLPPRPQKKHQPTELVDTGSGRSTTEDSIQGKQGGNKGLVIALVILTILVLVAAFFAVKILVLDKKDPPADEPAATTSQPADQGKAATDGTKGKTEATTAKKSANKSGKEAAKDEGATTKTDEGAVEAKGTEATAAKNQPPPDGATPAPDTTQPAGSQNETDVIVAAGGADSYTEETDEGAPSDDSASKGGTTSATKSKSKKSSKGSSKKKSSTKAKSTPKPSDDGLEAKGDASKKKGSYAEAIIYYKSAYNKTKKAKILKKIAKSYNALGKNADAKKYFLKYLDALPPAQRKAEEPLIKSQIRD